MDTYMHYAYSILWIFEYTFSNVFVNVCACPMILVNTCRRVSGAAEYWSLVLAVRDCVKLCFRRVVHVNVKLRNVWWCWCPLHGRSWRLETWIHPSAVNISRSACTLCCWWPLYNNNCCQITYIKEHNKIRSNLSCFYHHCCQVFNLKPNAKSYILTWFRYSLCCIARNLART